MSLTVVQILCLLAALVVWRLVRRFALSHPLDRIPGPACQSLITGNVNQLFSPDAWDFHRSLAETYGRVSRVFGPFKERQIYIHDPKALQHIFVKDQYVFDESIFFLAGNKAMFGDGLLSTLGHHHKKQRKMLNPVFSIANMRTMTSQFFDISYKLRDVFVRKTANGAQEIDVMEWMTRTALEIISQSGLGTSFDPISEDHIEHPYITSLKLLFPVARTVMALRMYIMPIVYKYKLGTPRIQRFLLNMTPVKALHKLRDISDVMHHTSLDVFNNAKKKAMAGEEVEDSKANHKDLLTILMQENAKASDEDKLPDSEVLAQISTFMFAGMDTTSSAVCRILWLLAMHQDVQDKLRAEIREAKRSYEQPDYDQLFGLQYLDAVCRESLRLYGPVSTIAREARKDAVLPLSKPIKTVDGEYIQEIHVPKGTIILASLRASNTTPELWGPDSYEWKPERWLSPLPEEVIEAHIPGVYSHLMTFIGGGRACIGFKFSEMEMKVLLYILIDQFKFSLPKQEIFWTMPGVASPRIDPTGLKPEMPMLVSRAA